MPLMELSLDTTNEAVDWICTLLAEDIAAGDVQITEYIPPQPDASSDWNFTVRLYLPYDAQARTRTEKIINLLSPLQRTGLTTAIETTVVSEKAAIADIFQPLIHRIGKRLAVVTADATDPSTTADTVTIKLQPSLAFGSGLHPATILSLQLLEKYVLPTMNVLDLGSGTGILSVAIAKLGAQVLALDNDPIAVQATQETVILNGVAPQVKVMSGSLGSASDLGHWMGGDSITNVPKIHLPQAFDLIVANILARIHIAIAKDYHQALRQTHNHQGILITAGFTTDHEESVTEALTTAGFEVIDCVRFNEWVALAHRC